MKRNTISWYSHLKNDYIEYWIRWTENSVRKSFFPLLRFELYQIKIIVTKSLQLSQQRPERIFMEPESRNKFTFNNAKILTPSSSKKTVSTPAPADLSNRF